MKIDKLSFIYHYCLLLALLSGLALLISISDAQSQSMNDEIAGDYLVKVCI